MRIVTRLVLLFLFVCFSSMASLAQAATISGTVTADDGGAPLEGIRMTVSRKSDGARLLNTYTDASGFYEFTMSEDRDDLVVWTRTVSPLPYFPEVYPDLACADGFCDVDEILLGTSIDTTTGNKVVDMSLARSASISGTLSRSDPAGLLSSGQGVARVVRQSDGTQAAVAITDANGFYRVGALAPGSYYLRLTGSYSNLIDELYDDANGIACPQLFCDKSSARVFTITGTEDIVNIDATLDPGTQFSGNVSENGTPLDNIFINFYAETGELVGSGRTANDGSGDYVSTSGFPAGNYRASNRWVKDGVQQPGNEQYFPTAYPDTPCGTPCDVTAGSTIAAPGTATTVSGIDFNFNSPTISGTVLDGGSPVEGIAVCVHYKSSGEFAGVCGYSDSSGNYTTPGLSPSNDYMAYASGYEHGYKQQIYGGGDCPAQGCDYTSGTAIDLTSSNATGIDFNLTPSDPGIISGYILNHADQPEPGGAVWVVDHHGNWHGHFWTDENGYFESWPLPTGTYYAVTQHTYGYIDDVWDGGDGAQCPNQFCTPEDYEPISLRSGSTVEFTLRLDEIGYDYRIRGNVQDIGANPLDHVNVNFFNSDGRYLGGVRTDQAGNYESNPMLEDNYYVRTSDDYGKGLAAVLYDDHQCVPEYDCDDPTYMATNGVQVPISGGDTPGINFVLTDAPGLRVQGQITDSVNGKPLARVGVNLHDESGNGINYTETDEAGNYKFLGVDPGTYRVLVNGPPEGYEMQLFNGIPCPDWNCDISLGGDVVVGTGDGVADIALVYTGTRIMGTVTRSNGGAPVASDYGWMSVSLFDAGGNHIGGADTDMAGNYQLHLPDSGGSATYYVSTDHDQSFHALINECWNDVKCDDIYDPLNNGSNPIVVADGMTEVADFALDDAVVISGTVVATDGGAPIPGVYLDLFDDQGNHQGGNETAADGTYKLVVPGPGDYYVHTPSWGLPAPYLPEVWQDKPCNTDADCDLFAVGNAITVGGSSVTGTNFSLESGFVISGFVNDDGGNPIDGLNVCVHRTDGSFTGVCGSTDVNGYYETGGLPAGTDYVPYAIGDDFGLKRQMWDHVDCNAGCDFGTGAAINLNSGDATNINFDLVPSDPGTISGHILKHDDSSAGGGVRLFDENNQHWGDFWTDENGYWETHDLPTGTYFAVTWHTDEVIDDAWDGGDGAQCPNLLCNLQEYTPIHLSSGEAITGIEFRLDEIDSGGEIHGYAQDESGNPIARLNLALLNRNGEYLGGASTDEYGNYNFGRQTDERYYVRTYAGPLGRAAELYDDVPCLPESICEDPSFVTGNGFPIDVNGGDHPSVDFELGIPSGWKITGKVRDDFTGAPLSNVSVTLRTDQGHWLGEFQTDRYGDYYFTGLLDDTYIVFAEGVPHNYEQQVYSGVACQDWSCDPFLDGTPVVVSGGDEALVDIRLVYTGGTRITGQIFRSDNSEPVSSDFGWFEVYLFDAAGNHVDTANPNTGGVYQFHLDGSGDFYLSTNHDESYHALINECFDNNQCPDIWDPVGGGATLFSVAQDETYEAIFNLDPAVVISGTVVATDDGTPIQDVQLDLWDTNGHYQTQARTRPDGTYKLVVPGPGDYYVLTPPWGVPSPYMAEVWQDQQCNLHTGCDPIAIGTPITVGGTSETGIDFSLESGFVISGFVKDDGGNPIDGLGVCVHRTDGSFAGVCGSTDGNGYYETGGLPAGTDYVPYAIGDDFGLKRQMWEYIDCDGHCDFPSGTAIDLSSDDARNINFDLSPSDPGTISGHILDHNGNPNPGGAVRLYNQNGEHMGDVWSDENGYWESWHLPTGTYYALTFLTYGVVDDVWDGNDGYQCPNQLCNPLDHQPIHVGSGMAVTGIDFWLDPIGSGGTISGHVQDGAGNNLSGVVVVLRNNQGNYLMETRTGQFGEYEFHPSIDDTYYVNTRSGPLGLGAELYDDIPCLPVSLCDDPSFAVGGSPVVVSGGDYPGVDFELTMPSGWIISGKVKDSDTGKPLPGVWVNLYDDQQNWYAEVETDQFGDYYFSGMSNGEFRVYVQGVPEGYEQQAYSGVPCQDWSCDLMNEGTPVNVQDADEPLADIDLVYTGTRLFGTVTRTDNGDPVSGWYGWAAVNVFDSSGNHIGGQDLNNAGQYQLHLPGPGDYYLSTDTQPNFHALINECWDDVKCEDIWDPKNHGGWAINVPADTTVVADFVLDSATVISGRVIDADTSLPVVGVDVGAQDLAQTTWQSASTDSNGEYKIVIPAPGDYIVFMPAGGVPSPYLPEVWPGIHCNEHICDPFSVGTPITVGSSSVTGNDFQLESGFAISGIVRDDGGNPMNGVGVCVHRTDGSFTGVCGGTDSNGYYETGGLPAATDYVPYAIGFEFGFKEQMWDHQDCNAGCDFGTGTPINLSSGDAPNIDFDLTPSDPGTISGSILRHDDTSPGGAVILYDQNGNWFDQFWTDGDGNWETYPIPTGVYYAVTKYTYNVVDDAWDGGDGAQCPNQLCNLLDYEQIHVTSGNAATGIDFRLDWIDSGGVISGQIQDESASPQENVLVFLWSREGVYLGEARTDQFGFYQFNPVVDDTYYVSSWHGSQGQPPELFDDVKCLQWYDCYDGLFAAANGDAVVVSGGDYPGVDFVLNLLPGQVISGKVVDNDTTKPLPGIWAFLYDNAGNFVAEFETNPVGDYYFSGLADGSYRVYVALTPQGYEDELYADVPCSNWNCDIALDGTPVNVSGSDVSLPDIGLQYTGTRIFGTVTRTDNGDPVARADGWVVVNLFDDAGNHIDTAEPNLAGQYQFEVSGDQDYYLSTDLDLMAHGLKKECWEDTPCPDSYDPIGQGATLLSVPADTTVLADFALDSETLITGRITSSVTGEGLAWAHARLHALDGSQVHVEFTDEDGYYAMAVPAPGTYYVLLNNRSGNLIDELYDGPGGPGIYCPRFSCDYSAGLQITIAEGELVTSVDESLDPGSQISGFLTEGGNPVSGLNMWFYNPTDSDGVRAAFGFSVDDGSYISRSGLPAGSYYVSSQDPDNLGNEFEPMVYDNVLCGDPCDRSLGNLVVVDGVNDVTDINFDLVRKTPAPISGTVSVSNGDLAPNARAHIYDALGNFVDSDRVDDEGYWETGPLVPGTYYAVTKFATVAVDDRWDGNDGEPCPNFACDPTGGAPIEVRSGVPTTGIDFVLDPITSGGVISGRVTNGSGDGLHWVGIQLLNSNGQNLGDTLTDENGNYDFGLRPDGRFYVRTWSGPNGLAPEVYDDKQCQPYYLCDDRSHVASVGDPVDVTGVDYPGVDFVLERPPGSVIFGKIVDDNTGRPLSEVWVSLFDDQSSWLTGALTDEFGNFGISGLSDGDYYVYADALPDGYEQELYNDLPCPGKSCNFGDADLVTVSGGDVTLPDIGVKYTGTRITGIVTRSDTGDPVPYDPYWFYVNLFDESGERIDRARTDHSGQYKLDLPGPGNYYLSTSNSRSHRGLINECWNDVKCLNNMDPIGGGAELITVAADTTVIADFELDPGSVISGTVTAEVGGAPLEGVEMCVRSQLETSWSTCTMTDASGFYELRGLVRRNDYEVFTNDLNGHSFYKEMNLDNECCDAPGDSVDTTVSDQVVDFALEASASISGNVVDSSNGNAVEGSRVWLISAQCEFLTYGDTDKNGDFTIAGFGSGTYYIAAFAEYQGYISTIYPNEQRMNVCHPDIQDGQAIVIGDTEQLIAFDFALDPGSSISGFVSDSSGVLPNGVGGARLYDFDGNTLVTTKNWNGDGSYTIGGVIPGTYQVVLTSYGAGLVDERFDDETCPRNSCDPELGVPVVVGPAEHVMDISAELAEGAVISGTVTDVGTLSGVEGYCVAFYTSGGVYAAFACADENGDYEISTGLPDGEYLMSNAFWTDAAAGGYLAQAWTDDGSFVPCGEPCDFLLGDTFTVSGTAPVTGIDLQMEKGSNIPGSVSDAGLAPISGIDIQLLSSVDGSVIRTVTTDAGGLFAFEGVGSGIYHVRTTNIAGYEDLLFASPMESCNPFCDPLSGADVDINGVDDHAPIDFVLATTPVIEGNVTDNLGTEAFGVKVEAYNTLGIKIAETTTNSSGNYSLANLWEGTFFVRTANTSGFVDALYDSQPCPAGCDPKDGTEISLIAGETRTGVDMQMSSAANISGTVSDSEGVLSGVTVELYLDTGAFVASRVSNGSGYFLIDGLSEDDYHLVTRNSFGYIDEGAGGEVCQAACNPASTTVVTVGENASVVRDFTLEKGGIIEGSVFGGGSTELQGVRVSAFNSDGTRVGTTVTDSSGAYQIGGLLAGPVYLRTLNAGGYRNQLFDSLPCDAGCNVVDGTAVMVTHGATNSGNDFHLESGFSVSGVVQTPGAVGLGGVLIEIFDADENRVAHTVSVTGGAFEFNGLMAGDYQLRTTNGIGYVDRVHAGSFCTPEPCALSSGVATSVVSSNVTGVTIELVTGTAISGVATDTSGNDLPTGTAWLYSATGQFLKSAAINNGLFTFTSNADGTYFVLISNTLGLVDQLYNGVDCPLGSCDIVSEGTPIIIGTPPSAQSTQGSGAGGVDKPQGTEPPRFRALLSQGYYISGSVMAQGKPVTFTKVYIFDANGSFAGEGTTDGLGNFRSESGFPNGSYYATTSREARPEDSPEEAEDAENGVGGGLADQVWSGDACDGICKPPFGPGNGTVIEVAGADRTDIHFVLDLAPGVDVEKTTNGIQADTANGGEAPEIGPGETVTWTYRVTNTGGGELTAISVADDDSSLVVNCGGQTTLAAGAFMECTATAPAVNLESASSDDVVLGNCAGKPSSRLYRNTATVDAMGGATAVTDQDSSHYCNPEVIDRPDLIFSSGFE